MCMCIYMYICICICMYMHMYTYTHTHTHTHLHIHTHIYIYIWMSILRAVFSCMFLTIYYHEWLFLLPMFQSVQAVVLHFVVTFYKDTIHFFLSMLYVDNWRSHRFYGVGWVGVGTVFLGGHRWPRGGWGRSPVASDETKSIYTYACMCIYCLVGIY